MPVLHLVSAGAAKGLVHAVQQAFEQASSMRLQAEFGAVGAMKEHVLQGAPCDVLILTQVLLDELARGGVVEPTSIRPLGRVYTGIAVPAGQPRPRIDDAETLSQMLCSASAIYFPDPERATAGIHFSNVMTKLGLREDLASRLRAFPNGATAMREMAQSGDPRAVGCTQVSEILYTPGVELVSALPKVFELATVYCASLCTRASSRDTAQRLVEMLAGEASESLRNRSGFEAG
jgi:molybdate transport system substrate-binding protein